MGATSISGTCIHCLHVLQGVPPIYLIGFLLCTLTGLLILGYVFVFLLAPVPRFPFPEEKNYQTILADGSITPPTSLPCWCDNLHAKPKIPEDAELFLSVVVPAYNEEKRLPGMLEEAVNYLERTYGTSVLPKTNGAENEKEYKLDGVGTTRKRNLNGAGTPKTQSMSMRGWEIIIVSDGSTDRTIETALAFSRDHQLSSHPKGHAGPWTPTSGEGARIPPGTIRVVKLTQNRGKGGAVTHGMRHVRGQYVVFADADGASNFNDLGNLVKACQEVEDSSLRGIAVGSRAHLVGSDLVVKRSKLRNFLMHAFHLTIRLLTPPQTARIKDTQCGFKLFSRATLPFIIPHMHSEGWIFDVEMLMLAEFSRIPVVEVPIGWREVTGSKLNVIWDSIGMAWGLAMLRAAWGLGVYKRAM
ncbi:dolichyl-phosphate beta-glucosyltransferase [Ophidiomyces ophidiicola]|uniref:Dolichyl-phosphate beta-glucosyltransferase n=1 Tax=Ophidiomyces ophidiicola TaxID=1387563 RepID=A0ACB8UQF6_9EURO|nr:dolichyl-phosphate beta-glucosyltransferase [Ophidiomyces ophidiicola]KAI1905973.1 dolichyl-phosphate beta-glucosyltransferase [Ophidiomyces ophidiicola]KAI1935846.1 dolichyl-phosphate beta-glucosyltransferase [Ophidiomyces ophidiicola]KAI1937385.1 dolichyl-phosphate beta-glucosyltransferase [Ophidiomyces ophidiicola]KAI1963827.1 dolichyl-phosphate beta-glucosyltransferase [Ophidiomyces ophidiicola]KAI1975541.1 dolichyl-phosphate beta-glucosyltransferase [Ophidiomyces ophidiicola]